MAIIKRGYKPTKAEAEASKNRLLQYVDMLRLSMSQFCLNAGMDRRWINTYTGNPGPSTRKALEETYPALNLDWVIFGVGNMINEGYEDNKKVIVSHRKPERASNSVSNDGGTVITQNGNDNNAEVLNGSAKGITLDPPSGNHFTLDFFIKKLDEKDKIIAKLSEMICELSKPCK